MPASTACDPYRSVNQPVMGAVQAPKKVKTVKPKAMLVFDQPVSASIATRNRVKEPQIAPEAIITRKPAAATTTGMRCSRASMIEAPAPRAQETARPPSTRMSAPWI